MSRNFSQIYETKSVTKKQKNKWVAEIYGPGKIRSSELVHKKPIP